MTHTHINKNNVPVYAEQKIIQTDLKVSDILKTKTPIPDNFLKLESKKRNYTCSTQGWKEPTCERFGFTYEEEWIQLDIPHTLMKELDLPLGEDIPYPVYISPQVLERKPICGGLTIENKKEIIIDKLSNKDQETQTNLTGQQILNQINQLQQEDNLNQQTIINLQGEIAELENKLTEIEGLKKFWENEWLAENRKAKQKINSLTNERDNLSQEKDKLEREKEQLTTQKDNEITELKRQVEKLEDEKKKLKDELEIEKGWWDKWINDNTNFNVRGYLKTKPIDGNLYGEWVKIDSYRDLSFNFEIVDFIGDHFRVKVKDRFNYSPEHFLRKKAFKMAIYEYYKSQS